MSYDDDTRRITNLHDTIRGLRAEIERLRRELNVLSELHAAAERECERLQAALREIVTTDPPQSSNDWFQEWKTLAFRLKSIARRTLEDQVEAIDREMERDDKP